MKPEKRYVTLVIALSVVLLLLVCGTGLWVYNRLSIVAENIVQSRPKGSSLLLLKELNTDLVTAENYVFSYAFEGNDTILDDFYLLKYDMDRKLGGLAGVPANDSTYPANIDTLKAIVDQRFVLMEEFVYLQNENRVHEAMDQVLSEVKTLTASRPSVKQQQSVQEPVEEKRRFFRKRKQAEPQQQVTQAPPPGVNAAVINRELVELKEDVVSKEQQKNSEKLTLEQRNNDLSSRFTQLVQVIESNEKKAILQEANAAKEAADETNVVIGMFCLTSVLLIIFVGYLIYSLIRKTRATNRQLLIAKEKSDQLTASKSRFLANMSHEIRTPLNAIVGFAEQLNHTQLRDDQQRKVGIIQKSAEHLAQITNDILDISKINSGAVQLEHIPVSIRDEVAFLEQALLEMVTRNENTLKIHLDQEVPEYVLGDALRIRQILFNLLSNAMKFTKNGTVKLLVKTAQQSTKQVQLVFAVSDNGIGISEEHISRIFDEFEQAETSTTRNYGGTGLGLSITRNLVRLMGGQIRVESEENKGTTFTVSLPMEIAEAQELDPHLHTSSDLPFLKGKRILIVDDEPYNRKLLRNMLQGWDTIITEVEDGEEAVKEVERSDYDLILLDLRMPKLDGFQTRKAIQQLNGEKAEIPVIALTAALTHEERLSMLEDQWKGVLLKPLKMRDLANCLKPIFDPDDAQPVEVQEPEMAQGQADSSMSLEPLKEISGNDRKFYLDMLRTFLRTTKDGIEAINQTSQLKDWEGMAEAAHKIASPVRHIQATEVYEMLKRLERAGRSNSIESTISQQISKLNESVEHILQVINQEIERVE